MRTNPVCVIIESWDRLNAIHANVTGGDESSPGFLEIEGRREHTPDALDSPRGRHIQHLSLGGRVPGLLLQTHLTSNNLTSPWFRLVSRLRCEQSITFVSSDTFVWVLLSVFLCCKLYLHKGEVRSRLILSEFLYSRFSDGLCWIRAGVFG